jgi:hypothetical protein
VIRTAACAEVTESAAKIAAARIAMERMLTLPSLFCNRFEKAPRLSSAETGKKFFGARIIGHGGGIRAHLRCVKRARHFFA